MIEHNEEPQIQEEEKPLYPSLSVRYQAMLIDGCFIIGVLIVIMLVMGENDQRQNVMVVSTVLMMLVYEQLLTAYSATIGQRMMKISVRRHNDPGRRIGLLSAYIRWIVKGLFGWLSFLTVSFDKKRRALHDLAGNTIVIEKR